MGTQARAGRALHTPAAEVPLSASPGGVRGAAGVGRTTTSPRWQRVSALPAGSALSCIGGQPGQHRAPWQKTLGVGRWPALAAEQTRGPFLLVLPHVGAGRHALPGSWLSRRSRTGLKGQSVGWAQVGAVLGPGPLARTASSLAVLTPGSLPDGPGRGHG